MRSYGASCNVNHRLDLLSLTRSRSAIDRIEQNGMCQGRRIKELLHQASHFNNALFHLIPKTSRATPNNSFELSRSSSSSVSCILESIPSRPRPRLDQYSAGVYLRKSAGPCRFLQRDKSLIIRLAHMGLSAEVRACRMTCLDKAVSFAMKSWCYLVIYSQSIMYNSMLIPKAKNFEEHLQTTMPDNCRVEPCNIYHNHNTRHIRIYCWTYAQQDKCICRPKQ